MLRYRFLKKRDQLPWGALRAIRHGVTSDAADAGRTPVFKRICSQPALAQARARRAVDGVAQKDVVASLRTRTKGPPAVERTTAVRSRE